MKVHLIIFFILIAFSGTAQEVLPLWPAGKMPNSKGLPLKDSVSNERLMEVGTPAIRAFFTSKQENKGAAVLIIPGGGYHHLSYQISGDQLAKWFNTLGMHAFVLNHRLPISPDVIQREIAPIQDAQRAMQVIRSHAEEWGIDKNLIGVMGCSAGGHLAATLGTFERNYTELKDQISVQPINPNFMILISPVIDFGNYAHKGSVQNLLGTNASPSLMDQYSLQKRVTPQTPATFLVHAQDDKAVPVQNSLLFYQALTDQKVSASIHVFPNGGHAISLRNQPGSTSQWPDICEAWLREMNFLKN